MSYKVSSIPLFDKQAKRLIKKYPSLKSDLSTFFESLEEDPEQGTAIGNSFYKVRLAIGSKGKGKSGGARVLLMLRLLKQWLFLHLFTTNLRKAHLLKKSLNRYSN